MAVQAGIQDRPVEIGPGVYWVGFMDERSGLHCNPYLIVEGREAMLIDGGSRTDFSTVMLKILQTGIQPSQIKYLLYQHHDPDLCGSISYLEQIIGLESLEIISHAENNIYIQYYATQAPKRCVEEMNYEMTFATGRKLRFIRTPYAHSPGSFVTFDERSGILFSSDLFGSFSTGRELYLQLFARCHTCVEVHNPCPEGDVPCPVAEIGLFHRNVMTSCKALQYAMIQMEPLPVTLVAPQHGKVIRAEDYVRLRQYLKDMPKVGIDAWAEEESHE